VAADETAAHVPAMFCKLSNDAWERSLRKTQNLRTPRDACSEFWLVLAGMAENFNKSVGSDRTKEKVKAVCFEGG